MTIKEAKEVISILEKLEGLIEINVDLNIKSMTPSTTINPPTILINNHGEKFQDPPLQPYYPYYPPWITTSTSNKVE